ncbi:MAG: hypothetical protein PUB89_13835 [Oscillospiraceae bacterium]|nr:hypothetical protein [Oscillospiraceae bacterium]MDD6083888.1 hypothetical protein [Oscillospiraceae bacterium]
MKSLSWNLEPLCSKVKNQQVKKSIQQAIVKTGCKLTFEEISEQFFLTKERNDRKFKKLSGERWRASAALGFVNGKTIFYAPYMTSAFYYQMNSINLFKVLRYLADNGAVVVLPVGSDRFIRNIADECIYLDPEYLK